MDIHDSGVLSIDQDVEVFYDGDCPLCIREINLLRRWDTNNKIRFTNIAEANFRSEAVGKTYQQLMAEIHGRLPDGSWITGVDVFRKLYSAVGFPRLVALTRIPGISQILDFGYRVFAKNRLRFTGRCSTDSASACQGKDPYENPMS